MTEPSHPSPVRLLKYGLNPQQGNASLEFADGVEWLRVLNGTLGYINVLDALKAWQLARELGRVFGRAAAASIKHVHPAGAAVAAPEVSDGIVAPGYAPAALQILRRKKGGRYVILQPDPDYEPPLMEVRAEGGLTLRQARNTAEITPALFERVVTERVSLASEAGPDLMLATIVARHAPSNAPCVAHAGQAIGIGGGQQARIYATSLACAKADLWRLQLHPRAAELSLPADATRTSRFNAVRQWRTTRGLRMLRAVDAFPASLPRYLALMIL